MAGGAEHVVVEPVTAACAERAVANDRGRPAPAVLEVVDATVRFGALQALQGVSLVVRRGDFIALVGANGSGKTTLLRLLHGLVPALGSLHERPSRKSTSRADGAAAPVVAMVFQRPFMLHLSVLNNLRLALWLARGRIGARDRAARAREALARVGLADLRDRPARVLSGGEQQRFALARAWAVGPDVLLLDEPTANLDPSAKKEVEALLAGFAAEGMTLVMSTHNLGQAKRLANRVVYLDQGRVSLDLPTAEFFGADASGRVRQFLKGELPWAVE